MLYLIGTSHLDMKSYERLSKLLDALNPSILCLEETEEGLKDAAEQHEWFSKKANIENTLKLMRGFYDDTANLETVRMWLSAVPQEYKAISEYCSRKNIQPTCCDIVPYSIDKIFENDSKNPKSSLNREFSLFLKLSPKDALEDIENEYLKEEYSVADSKNLTSFYIERDKFAEIILRAKFAEERENIVYVGGLDHLFGDYHPNLFERLSDLSPVRLKLNSTDKI